MSITDELREWAKEHLSRNSILAIADRIDAEHERQCAESWMRGHDAWAAIDRSDEMAERGWIRLPKDADGEYIRAGDVMDSRVDYLFDGKPFTVRELVLCEDGWKVADGRFGNRYEPDSLRHHHAPTVEDVLREMHAKLDEVTALYVGEAIDSDERDSDEARIFAEYAEKLQLREDA